MSRISWFDESKKVPVIDEQVHKLDTFVEAMADGLIEKQELEKQQANLIKAMSEVEPKLSDEQHEQVTRLLIELSAYNIMRLLHELHVQKLQRAFSS